MGGVNQASIPWHTLSWELVQTYHGSLSSTHSILWCHYLLQVEYHFKPPLCCSQTLSMPMILRSLYFPLHDDTPSSFQLTVNTLFCFPLWIWNLDFFRPFYSNLCLRIDNLPILALDYAVAIYPLFLMLITYLLIKLHD